MLIGLICFNVLYLFRRLYSSRNRLTDGFRKRFNIDRSYFIGGSELLLPAEHRLPESQSVHSLYDRFLPYIVKELRPKSSVLDIGANIGDSLAAMAASNQSLNYLCIEPEVSFLSYLNRNIGNLVNQFPKLRVSVDSRLISASEEHKTLVGENGTRHAELATGSVLNAVSVDALCKEFDLRDVSLIKSDVDGWDWDVIRSSLKVIERDKPIIYFEMMVTDSQVLMEYLKTLNQISGLGYSQFYLFDCFGAFMFETSDLGAISQYGGYLLSQFNSETTRAIYYIDIMCGVETNPTMQIAIENYLTWIADKKS